MTVCATLWNRVVEEKEKHGREDDKNEHTTN